MLYRRMLRATGDHAASENLVQEVAIRLVQRPPLDASEARLRTWIHVAARNLIVNN
ncbi:hypothetical protein IDH44_01920 [Paenibacillus sp. IB182496]|uniref:RNA polymerase sigma-70 region 2 domain-containing protein n=2 Tax=Paenibacillus sabuli TaxID=2772509 RepID=A0A927BQ81_9BACL|nr:hypothetical protein [Paenibacillus sabuli]